MIDELVEALQAIDVERTGAFATQHGLPASALGVEVEGVGRIRLPVPAATVKKLRAVARPARYGRGEQTLLDRSVRDTWEIPKRRVRIEQRAWKAALSPAFNRIRAALGLADGVELRAELHNMLVYETGQFFVAHQDSEKTDDMVATLVAMLPSAVRGGEMVVEHQGARMTFRGSAREVILVAFYADCRHEVRRVTSGHRVVLTYNLVIRRRGSRPFPPPDQSRVAALSASVDRYFCTESPARWPDDPRAGPPDRLVVLLDHEYSERGLAWHRLKNGDAVRAAALRDVARRLDCEVFVALADVHERWSCTDDGYPRYGYGRGRWRDSEDLDADEAPGDGGTPDLVDLEDSDVELQSFVDEAGRAHRMSASPLDSEIRFTRPSVEMTPFRSEHEGYMGNWGNTVNRWYHRAAVVMWPRERAFILRAKASPAWALGEIGKRLAAGERDEARELVRCILPFWSRVAREEAGSELLSKTLAAATGVDSKELAAALLEPFRVEALAAKHAVPLGALADRHGARWLQSVLSGWTSRREYRDPADQLKWLRSMPSLAGACVALKSAAISGVARWLAGAEWEALAADCRAVTGLSPSAVMQALADREHALLAMVESSVVLDDAALHRRILAVLASGELPLLARVGVLAAAKRTRRGAKLAALGLGSLRDQVAAEPARASTRRHARPATGPSRHPATARVPSASSSPGSSWIPRGRCTSGRSRRTAASTCTAPSPVTSCPSPTSRAAPAGRTRSS